MSAIMGDKKFEPVPEGPAPIWPDLEKLEPARLGGFLVGEHPQTSAMVLSKLAPQTAANVLLTMEKPMRSQIIKRMVTMANIPDAASRIVENQLRVSVLSQKASRDTSAGQERVASMLNEMAKPELDELMQDLENANTPDLAGVKSRLFAFDDLPLLPQKARVLLFDGLSTELVTLALRGAPPELAESALSAIGARSRRMIESELGQGSEGIALADIMAARKSISVAAIRLSREGAFELPSTQTAPAEAA
jgi:flagellar motor switch protein FliG